MNTFTPSNGTLATTLWGNNNGIARNVTLAFIGSIALMVSAKIQVPFYPVPMTMQTFAVLVIGMAFGWRLGLATVALYLFEGAMGFPVFAGTPEKGIGLAYMLGTTGGYLLGFLVSAAAVGYLAEKGWDRNVWTTLAAMTIGTAIILALGNLWLGSVIGWDKPILELGLLPFLPAAAFKIGLAALLLPAVWKLVSRKS